MRMCLSVLVILALLAPPALAADAPPFTVADIAPGDDERPEGWSPVLKTGLIPETAPSVKALLALGTAAELEDGAISARSRSIQKEDGAAAVLSLVGLSETSEAFTTALADAAVKHGWKVRELGSPARVAVVWSSDPKACPDLLTWQAHLAVRKISEEAIRRTRSIASMDDAHAVLMYLSNATKIEPDAALPHSVRGTMLQRMGNPDGALESLRKVINRNAPVPATPIWQVRAAGSVGSILLLKGNKEYLDEAAKALERAVELEEHTQRPVEKFGNAYNLACAYSRLGRLDDAFKLLEKSFETGKTLDDWDRHFEHAQVKDPDLQPLRGDPRFEALMKKYDPNPRPEKKPEDDKRPGGGDGGDK